MMAEAGEDAKTADEDNDACYDMWTSNNLTLEISYSIMCLMFVV